MAESNLFAPLPASLVQPRREPQAPRNKAIFRAVGKDGGFYVNAHKYSAPKLAQHIGRQIHVKAGSAAGFIQCFDVHGEFIAMAECPELSGRGLDAAPNTVITTIQVVLPNHTPMINVADALTRLALAVNGSWRWDPASGAFIVEGQP